MADLLHFDRGDPSNYSAKDIEVLEGLEPVRRRPGMYIGGTDERALHHLAAEILDNAMDEAVAGHANRIEMELLADGSLSVTDNGRGIPIDPHPKFKKKSALEVILTTLHSGGKFSGKAYKTSGGLHGVGLSVVNALSEELSVEVARDRQLWRQDFQLGKPRGKLKKIGAAPNRRGTRIVFHADRSIFKSHYRFKPERLHRMARSKAYLFRGVEIRWKCDPSQLRGDDPTPKEEVFHFPNGLEDFLTHQLDGVETVTERPFTGRVEAAKDSGSVEWAIHWPTAGDGFLRSYCNTIPTPEGGTHEAGLRAAVTRAVKNYGELTNNRKTQNVTADDILGASAAVISLFISDPQFSGQTKEKLASPEASRLVETSLRDHFDHWLSGNPTGAKQLVDFILERTEERLRRKQERDIQRKSAGRKARLPGKLADCAQNSAQGTELFIVEGDSAGGSAKQARDRKTQAILPLRGKILNVVSAGSAKLAANQELSDLLLALGCGTRSRYREDDLRYEKIIIMTDADVDGAHIASLLMTFFLREMPQLVHQGHLFLAQPPLYRMSQGNLTHYARDDAHREELLKSEFSGRGKVDISRFKGLGEMPPAQLKSTTMDPKTRKLVRVMVPPDNSQETDDLVEQLMGRKPEGRFQYIQEHAPDVDHLDI